MKCTGRLEEFFIVIVGFSIKAIVGLQIQEGETVKDYFSLVNFSL